MDIADIISIIIGGIGGGLLARYLYFKYFKKSK